MEQKNSSRKTFMVNTHGFEGDLFQASEGKHPNNVFIAVGGLKDKRLVREFATYFNCKGIDVLAVYFYGGNNLGLNQNLIPVEYVEAAVNQLKKMNFINIGITGISKELNMHCWLLPKYKTLN